MEADAEGPAVGADGVDGVLVGGSFRLCTGLGLALTFGDFGVEGELTWVGVGAFAAGVDTDAGEAAFSAPGLFFAVAAVRTGVG